MEKSKNSKDRASDESNSMNKGHLRNSKSRQHFSKDSDFYYRYKIVEEEIKEFNKLVEGHRRLLQAIGEL